MDRREALGILTTAIPTAASIVGGCPGAQEPPDIARGETRNRPLRRELLADARAGLHREFREWPDGQFAFVGSWRLVSNLFYAAWPDGIVPRVELLDGAWHVAADWTAADGPFVARVLRGDRGCVEELVGHEWRKVGP